MKITAVSAPSSGLTSITLEHKGKISNWDVSSTYSRTQNRNEEEIDTETLFAEINSYWASLSVDRQAGIWEAFESIRLIFEADYQLEAATAKLKQKVAVLYNYMPLAEIQHHLNFHADIQYPSSVRETLDQTSGNSRAERTYLRQDYFGLVSLSVALRPMIPIWGQFIDISRRELGNNYKEFQAFGLLYDTHLVRSNEIERLREFIQSSIASQTTGDKTFTPVLGGLGTTELPYWLMAMTCVRRLAPATVSGSGDVVNLIAKVHYYVDSKMKSLDRDFGRGFGGKVSEKKQTGAADDSNTSVVEMYKIKPDISDGDIVTLNVYAEDPFRMAAVRCPDLPPELLEASLAVALKLAAEDTYDQQKWLVKWIIDPVITAKAVDLLTIEPLLKCMAVTQAVLWHWGFYDLAAMVTSIPQVSGDDMMIGVSENRSRIPKEHLMRMQDRHPFSPPVKKNSSARQANVAARAVDRLADVLSKNDWILNAPPALAEKTSRIGNSRMLSAPPNLKIQLSDLLEHPQFALKRVQTP
ncbi:hypothetical protein [Xanthomonas phage RTH11]|nr:hypothetical protein [Xanthomonas phage RTH11]